MKTTDAEESADTAGDKPIEGMEEKKDNLEKILQNADETKQLEAIDFDNG